MGAKADNIVCMKGLAHCYDLGYGVKERNFHKAFILYSKAAKLGDPEAEWRLAYALDNGIGVHSDLNKAFYWYLKSAEAGDENGMVYLAYYYEHGAAMTRSLRDAAYWYMRAAKLGNIFAINWLKEHSVEVTGEEVNLPDQLDEVGYTTDDWREYFNYFRLGERNATVHELEEAIKRGEISEVEKRH
jgi:hypothetical protein